MDSVEYKRLKVSCKKLLEIACTGTSSSTLVRRYALNRLIGLAVEDPFICMALGVQRSFEEKVHKDGLEILYDRALNVQAPTFAYFGPRNYYTGLNGRTFQTDTMNGRSVISSKSR